MEPKSITLVHSVRRKGTHETDEVIAEGALLYLAELRGRRGISDGIRTRIVRVIVDNPVPAVLWRTKRWRGSYVLTIKLRRQ